MEDGLVDRVERAFVAAVNAHMEPVRLELTRAEHEELSRQYGVVEGLRMYRGRPVVIASEVPLGNGVTAVNGMLLPLFCCQHRVVPPVVGVVPFRFEPARATQRITARNGHTQSLYQSAAPSPLDWRSLVSQPRDHGCAGFGKADQRPGDGSLAGFSMALLLRSGG